MFVSYLKTFWHSKVTFRNINAFQAFITLRLVNSDSPVAQSIDYPGINTSPSVPYHSYVLYMLCDSHLNWNLHGGRWITNSSANFFTSLKSRAILFETLYYVWTWTRDHSHKPYLIIWPLRSIRTDPPVPSICRFKLFIWYQISVVLRGLNLGRSPSVSIASIKLNKRFFFLSNLLQCLSLPFRIFSFK